MRASDRHRLIELERELTDCVTDRYYGDLNELYDEHPHLASLNKELFEHLDSQHTNERIPTYFYYWEEENYRRWLWRMLRDSVARAISERLDRACKETINGRTRRLKRVGDGSHSPLAETSSNND